jgi:hypothetical protein
MLTEVDRSAVLEAYSDAERERRDVTGCYLAAKDALQRRRPELPAHHVAAMTVRIVLRRRVLA